ncbi:hypothetical protein [Rhodopirellula sallentina]|uniref:hypothetical protein n=1 Tax=Rhodopirellula sallentina TaxID=1263869 RepID=UPI0005C7ADA5|nr:hypothetical protein [Rhodopirellula sallentina]
MGWLFREGITRKELIEDRTSAWERTTGDLLIRSNCLARCYRGGSFSGVLWAVWERTFSIEGIESQPAERWITCDLIQYQRNSGWGYKDLDESMGPYFYSCPMKYLNLVPIEQFGGNADWRSQVISHHKNKREKRMSLAK